MLITVITALSRLRKETIWIENIPRQMLIFKLPWKFFRICSRKSARKIRRLQLGYTPWDIYKLKADGPILEGIMAKTWDKEEELKQLKSELATFDRKIAAELAPKQENSNDGEEIKKGSDAKESADDSKEVNDKKTMVAEPNVEYTPGLLEFRDLTNGINPHLNRRGII